MYIKDIKITNFRGLSSLEIKGFKDINLLLGKNNCGKTSVLEALFLHIGMSNPILVVKINTFRDIRIEDNEDLRYIFYQLDYKNKPQIFSKMYNTGFERDLKIFPASASDKAIEHNEELKEKNLSSSRPVNGKENINELKFKFSVKEKKSIKEFESGMLIKGKNNIHFNIPEDYTEKLEAVYIPAKTNIAPNLEDVLNEIVESKQEKEIVEILNYVDPKIQGIRFGKDLIYLDVGYKRLIPLNLAGDGIRKILAVILGIYNAKNGVLLIDEIENGLHYSTLKQVWKAIFKAGKKFKVQIFVTTHNYETLKYLKEALEDSADSDKKRTCSITIRKHDENNFKAYNYYFEEFEHAINHETEIR